jgi:hypothetical protein
VVPVFAGADAPASVSEGDCPLVFRLTCGVSDCFGFLDGLDLAPVVRGRIGPAVTAMRECQKETAWMPVFGISAAAAYCLSNEPERFCFAFCRRD